MNKLDLHRLVEKLDESQIPTVGTFIGYVLQHSGSGDAHDQASYDDEDFSEEELASLDEAHQEYLRGEIFSQDEIERRYDVG